MRGFFWRVFLGYWVVIVFSILITVFVVALTTDNNQSGKHFRDQLLRISAAEVSQILAGSSGFDRENAFASLPELPGFFDLYILNSVNQDIRNREVPLLVQVYAAGVKNEGLVARDRTLHPRMNHRYVYSKSGEQFLLIGKLNILVFGELLLLPGARSILGISGLLMCAVLAYLLARFIMLPVSKLQHAGRKIAQGDLTVRISEDFQKRKDSLAELARDFDFMANKIDLLIKTHEQLVTDMSHELRSPLARLQASVSLARQKGEKDLSQELDRIEKESESLSDLVGQILTYSKITAVSDYAFELTDIVDLVKTIYEDAQYEASTQNKSVEFRCSFTQLLTKLNNNLISSAIENIVRNALKYTPTYGKVVISLNCTDLKVDAVVNEAINDSTSGTASNIIVEVSDEGCGVPEKDLTNIFQPFYRVDESRSTASGGGGIGLAIAYRAARMHNGEVVAKNRPEGGLLVRLSLMHEP